MAADLVVESQGTVHDAVICKNDGVVERTGPNQAHGAKRLDFAFETEGTRSRQQLAKTLLAHVHFELLLANEGMRKIHEAFHVKFIGRIDTDTPAVFDNLPRLQDFQITPPLSEPPGTRLLEHLHKRFGGT